MSIWYDKTCENDPCKKLIRKGFNQLCSCKVIVQQFPLLVLLDPVENLVNHLENFFSLMLWSIRLNIWRAQHQLTNLIQKEILRIEINTRFVFHFLFEFKFNILWLLGYGSTECLINCKQVRNVDYKPNFASVGPLFIDTEMKVKFVSRHGSILLDVLVYHT